MKKIIKTVTTPRENERYGVDEDLNLYYSYLDENLIDNTVGWSEFAHLRDISHDYPGFHVDLKTMKLIVDTFGDMLVFK